MVHPVIITAVLPTRGLKVVAGDAFKWAGILVAQAIKWEIERYKCRTLWHSNREVLRYYNDRKHLSEIWEFSPPSVYWYRKPLPPPLMLFPYLQPVWFALLEIQDVFLLFHSLICLIQLPPPSCCYLLHWKKESRETLQSYRIYVRFLQDSHLCEGVNHTLRQQNGRQFLMKTI